MKRKKKRKRSREAEGRYEVSRRPGVHLWSGSETKSDKGYYIDTRGDYDNLVYGSLYRYVFLLFLCWVVCFVERNAY